ncbi:anti sigma-E factor RseA C-terminal domain-containing protein [Proteus vulgaris]
MFNTQPIMGSGAPVSLNFQNDTLGKDQQTRLQERNQRLGLMLQQYELDRRIYNAPQNEAPANEQGVTQPVTAQ